MSSRPEAQGPGAVEWLAPDEMRAWRGLVDLIVSLQAEQDEALEQAHGFGEGEYAVLARLSEAPDHRRRMCDLAMELRLSPSGLTRRIDALVKRGWVSREQSTQDRRVMLAALTPEGMHRLEHAAPTHVAAVRHSLFDHLAPEDVAALDRLLQHAHASRRAAGL